jgi:hypothetical protein
MPMRLRRLLGPLAAVWIACQLCFLVGGPIALVARVADEEPECTCTHGDHAMCPMHHRSSGLPQGWCAIGCDEGAEAGVLASVTGAPGILHSTPRVVDPPSTTTLGEVTSTTAIARPSPPDPPPPRV